MRLPSFAGVTRPSCYALIAPVLLLVPHAAVSLLLRVRGTPLSPRCRWWLPCQRWRPRQLRALVTPSGRLCLYDRYSHSRWRWS